MDDSELISVEVEFGGGLHSRFNNETHHKLRIPRQTSAGTPPNVIFLAQFLTEKFKLAENSDDKNDLLDGETIRPGVLVIINDADWELEGEEKYKIQDGDHIMFITTLHGG